MFIERVLQRMDTLQISRKKITEDLHFGKNQIKYWEDHHNVPRMEIVMRIAEYLNTSADYLLGHRDSPEKEKPEAEKDLRYRLRKKLETMSDEDLDKLEKMIDIMLGK